MILKSKTCGLLPWKIWPVNYKFADYSLMNYELWIMNYELNNPPDYRNDTVLPLPPEVSADAWAVDAACSGNPGKMEYRCIDLATGAVVFHFGPVFGTNHRRVPCHRPCPCAYGAERHPQDHLQRQLHGDDVGEEDAVQDQTRAHAKDRTAL